MTDMRRTLLWVVFLSSIFFLYDAWNKHNGRPSFFEPPAARPTASAPASVGGAKPGNLPSASAASPGIAASGPAPATAPETVVVTTDLLKATLDSRGGTLVRLELLKQKQTIERPWHAPLVDIFRSGEQKQPEAPNVVLFDRTASRVYVAESGVLNTPNPLTHLTPMTVLPGERSLKEGAREVRVSFATADQGVKLVKTYVFQRGKYTVDVRHELNNLGDAPVAAPQVYLQLTRDGAPGPGGSAFYSTFTGPAVYTENSKFTKVEFNEVDKGSAKYDKSADNGWIAMVQHYFASAWLHNPAQTREFSIRATDAKDTDLGQRVYSVAMVFTLPALAPKTTQGFDAVLFAGPQEENSLAALAPGLELVKDYGVLTILAKPLFSLLDWLHKYIGNWGWSIVALVVILKIAFYWLNASAYRSMAKMKAINPKVMELKERYKDKPQQMQQEMLRIYREEKVNPFGGCLPIFIQMPFFIALYWVLLSSVEMRHAPWVGWIHDLSVPDPYFILPLLMTATSMIQVALGAKPPDPVQARMMWMMPLIFSVMFFFFPAGLVLYWLTNNVLSIAQQYMINKQMGVQGK